MSVDRRNLLAKTTEKAAREAKPPSARGIPVLVAVLPRARAVPVPTAVEGVGREWFADKLALDPRISRRHVAFRATSGIVHVRDLGSDNGTHVDGAPLGDEEVRLRDGALLRIGDAVLVFREAFLGSDAPDAIEGGLVAPFGLRRFRAELDAAVRQGPSHVLIEGESGTGKELAARLVAEKLRPGSRFGAINAAALNDGTFESQLFGHVKGAFTGAANASVGFLRAHDRGVVFLDEFGDLARDAQAKLLRAVELGEAVPVGGTSAVKFDVLFVAATNRPLDRMAADGDFRRDLLARFPVRLRVPPLRERAEDVLAIAMRIAKARGAPLDPARMEPAAVERLLLHRWEDNVRELDAKLRAVRATEGAALPRWKVDEVLGKLELARPVLTRERVLSEYQRLGSARAVAKHYEQYGVSRREILALLGKADRDPPTPPEAGSRTARRPDKSR